MTAPGCLVSALFGRRPKSLTYHGPIPTGTVDGATHTFNNVPIGEQVPERTVIIAVGASHHGAGIATLSSATINGVAATITVQKSSGGAVAAIIQASGITGNTATVTVTFNSSRSHCRITPYAAYSLNSATATATATANSATSSLAITPASGGFAIGKGISDGDGAMGADFTQDEKSPGSPYFDYAGRAVGNGAAKTFSISAGAVWALVAAAWN